MTTLTVARHTISGKPTVPRLQIVAPTEEIMALGSSFHSHIVASLFAFIVISTFALGNASAADQKKTMEFNVKVGGVAYTVAQGIGDYGCSFTYAAQGGTNELWQMTVELDEDDDFVWCSVQRPQGKRSYLFFTQFRAELKGAYIKHAGVYSQAGVGGGAEGNVPLKPEEFSVGDFSVTQTDGKFRAELSKVVLVGQTLHSEL